MKAFVKYNLIMGLVLVLSLSIFYQINSYFLKEAIRAYDQAILSRVDGRLSDWINERIANIQKIKAALENYDIRDYEQLKFSIKRLQEASLFPYLIVGSDEGVFTISDDDFVASSHYDPRKREWYIDTLGLNKTIVTKPYVSMRYNLPAVSICTPLSIMGKVAVTCGGQPFELIQEYISSFDLLYDKALYLVDQKGIVLASSNHLQNPPNLLNIAMLNKNDYVIVKVDNTSWHLIFEKNKSFYERTYVRYLFVNIVIIILLLAFTVAINLFWYRRLKLTQTIEVPLETQDFINVNLEKTIAFIEKNLDDVSLNIDKLSSQSGYSKYHLQRVFKGYCGENIASYIRRLRLQKSVTLLLHSEEKILDIAYKCGYDYVQTFIRSFEKYYEISPSELRAQKVASEALSYEEIGLKKMELYLCTQKVDGSIGVIIDDPRGIKGETLCKYALFNDTGGLGTFVVPEGRYAKIVAGEEPKVTVVKIFDTFCKSGLDDDFVVLYFEEEGYFCVKLSK